MEINVNTSNISPIVPSVVDATAPNEIAAPKVLPDPILGSQSLTVSYTTPDIGKLAAQLLAETNQAREESIIGQLKALSESGIFEKLHAEATEENDRVYTGMEELSKEMAKIENEQLPAAEKAAKNAAMELADATKAKDDAQQALDNAQANLDALKASDTVTEEQLAAAEQAVEKAQDAYDTATSTYDAAVAADSAAKKTVDDLKAQLETLDQQMGDLLASLDTEGFRMLAEAFAIDFSELNHTTPLEDTRDGDEPVGNIPLSERSPLSIIRESLRRLAGDMVDSLAMRREQHV